MKALIRNSGETVTEADGIPGINWDTGMPLTNPVWAGGPYTLVEEKPAEQSAESLPETVLYGGKEYTLEELKKLIG